MKLSLLAGPLASTAALLVAGALAVPAAAFDHGEAPLVSRAPKTDGTDLFVFRSYEPGREDFVTLIACFQPFQDPFAGPDYFLMDPDALYEIHVDNDGDGMEDLTFRFRFENELGPGIAGEPMPRPDRPLSSPFFNVEPFMPMVDPPEAAIRQTYCVNLVVHGRGGGIYPLVDRTGNRHFVKPVDNIGTASFDDYESYARQHVYELDTPARFGRVFVGQRKDPRAIAMGALFDLVHEDLLGRPSARESDLARKNVTALALEVPVNLLKAGSEVIGVWSTASLLDQRTLSHDPDFDSIGTYSGRWTQVSRTGAPLVNAFLIGFMEKDRFNTSHPSDDVQFQSYFEHPYYPRLIEDRTGLPRPFVPLREDVCNFFMRGIRGLTSGGHECEVLRFLYAVPPVEPARQNALGVLAGDLAGYPNGRRPGDDVVDITLRLLMGAMLPPAEAPSGGLPLTDGVAIDASDFDARFPYLTVPLAGAS